MKYYRSPLLSKLSCENIFSPVTASSVDEAKSQGVDFIDLTYADYLLALEQFSMSGIDAYALGAADCLLKIDGQYQFFQLSQKAILSYLSSLKISLQVSDVAVIVGDQLTISQFAPALAKLGYSKFIFVVEDQESVIHFVQKMQRTFLGLQFDVLQFKQISQIDSIASFLLVDVDHENQIELVESLTYFNFLTTGSVFFDVRSIQSNELVQEATRAQMFVLDSAKYNEARLCLADQILTKKIK
jgi:hypothetical protein